MTEEGEVDCKRCLRSGKEVRVDALEVNFTILTNGPIKCIDSDTQRNRSLKARLAELQNKLELCRGELEMENGTTAL